MSEIIETVTEFEPENYRGRWMHVINSDKLQPENGAIFLVNGGKLLIVDANGEKIEIMDGSHMTDFIPTGEFLEAISNGDIEITAV